MATYILVCGDKMKVHKIIEFLEREQRDGLRHHTVHSFKICIVFVCANALHTKKSSL